MFEDDDWDDYEDSEDEEEDQKEKLVFYKYTFFMSNTSRRVQT